MVGGGGAAVHFFHHDEAADSACGLEARGAAKVLAPGEVSDENRVQSVELVFLNHIPAVVDEVGGFSVAPSGGGPFTDRPGDAPMLAVVGVDERLVAHCVCLVPVTSNHQSVRLFFYLELLSSCCPTQTQMKYCVLRF